MKIKNLFGNSSIFIDFVNIKLRNVREIKTKKMFGKKAPKPMDKGRK